MSQFKQIAAKNKKKMLQAVRKTTNLIGRDIIKRSPVDTGLFKSTWYAANGAPHLSVEIESGYGLTETVAKMKIGQPFYFTNSQPYAIPLEYGHSGQAPNGMVRLALAQFQYTVDGVTSELIQQ